jgi:ABC-2 type transport system ATP-binding protein
LETALTVRGLTKYYGTRRAVNSLELEVNRGEVYGLLGHNGAGKTTSIECILGVKRCDAGTIELLGMKPSSDRQKLFEKVGVQFQQTYYQEKIRVEEICEVTSSLYQKPRRWKELLESFGLSGMEKRIGIAVLAR